MQNTPNLNAGHLFWDPVGEDIFAEKFDETNKKIIKKISAYLENPNLPLRNLLLFSIPGVLILGFFIFSAFLGKSMDFKLIFLGFLPTLFYWAYISNIQQDSTNLLLAKENGWIYNPAESPLRWQKFNRIFPQIFINEGLAQVEDEFWGNFENTPFYTSIFSFQRKKGKQSETVFFNVFALKLTTKHSANFSILRQNLGGFSFFGLNKGSIETESSEFNRTFLIRDNSGNSAETFKIIKTLSPAVQEELLSLKKQFGNVEIGFCAGIVVFKFEGKLLPNPRTNFFRDMRIDERDRNEIMQKISQTLTIGQNISKYLD